MRRPPQRETPVEPAKPAKQNPDRTVQVAVWIFAIVEAAGIAYVLWHR